MSWEMAQESLEDVKVRKWIKIKEARGELNYGIHVSDTALMTCLVESAGDYRHVHFIDGGDGGYTLAAREMKTRIAAQAQSASIPQMPV